jgi:hypothetical protein
MDAIRIAGAQSREQAPQASSQNARHEAPEAAIRTLDDWELLLAGGGSEVSPEWP